MNTGATLRLGAAQKLDKEQKDMRNPKSKRLLEMPVKHPLKSHAQHE